MSAVESRVPRVPESDASEIIWHDLECGSYQADLSLWLELAEHHPGPVLDIGAGAGRVALELGRAGHAVTALEREPALLEALRARAHEMSVRCVCADARSFELPAHSYSLCLVPMQTVQLLGGACGRAAFLRRARAALRPGGVLACAVLGRVDPFDCASGEPGPLPETAMIDGLLYMSVPTRVALRRRGVVIARERRVLAPTTAKSSAERVAENGRLVHAEASVVELDRLSPRTLRREGIAAGLQAQPDREIAPTEDHSGSTVVIFRA
jgi:SAM-dependent methyltransferase